jgi:hypothetical protein
LAVTREVFGRLRQPCTVRWEPLSFSLAQSAVIPDVRPVAADSNLFMLASADTGPAVGDAVAMIATASSSSLLAPEASVLTG